MDKIKRGLINSVQEPSQQMPGTAGQGAHGPPTVLSPGSAARCFGGDTHVHMILSAPDAGKQGAPSRCLVTDDHFSPIKLKLKDPQT